MTKTIVVKQTFLRELVERAVPVVPVNAPRPVLKNLLVQAAPGSLRISATDLDLAVVVSSPMVAVNEPVEFIIPAVQLREILKELPETDISIAVYEPAEGITRVDLTAGSSGWTLQVPNGTFPSLPDTAAVTWESFDRAAFIAAVRLVRFAASKDAANLGLACVSVARQGDGSAKVTASDGSRLQQSRLAAFPLSIQIPAIGSPSVVDEVLKLLARNEDLPTADVAQTASHLMFRCGNGVFASRGLTAPGANVEKQILVPASENKLELEVSRSGLLEAIRRAAITADAHTSAICLQLTPGKLTVISRDKNGNGAEHPLDAPWEGKERRVVVNYRALSEAVSAGSAATCVLRLSSGTSKRSAVLIRDDSAGVVGVVPQMMGQFLGY